MPQWGRIDPRKSPSVLDSGCPCRCLTSGRNGVYELLSSFSSLSNKAEFLSLLQPDDETRCEEDMIMVPRQGENKAAQPIARVLPANVMRQVTVIATMLCSDSSDTVQQSCIPSRIDCTV
jgi:hypothetical protein